MSRASIVVLVVSLALSADAADPAAALSQGKQAILNKEYARAVNVLQDAVPDAANLSSPQREQALAALHFYTALAFNGMKNDAKTREELELFFEFSPQTNRIDTAKYDGRFVRHFNEVRKIVEGTGGASFDTAYPGYRTFSDREPRERPLDQWGEGPDMILLGTAEEKTAWKKASDDIARRMFIEEFWRQRDPNPDTEENEYRSDFQRRVAFADHMFVTEKTRGSLTDRGRVFVLFGPPRIVRQSNLAGFDAQNTMDKRGPVAPAQPVNPQDALTAGARAIEESNRRMASGTIAPVVKGKSERWLYGREQLPKGFPEDYLAFKFITQEGYGENVLQRDPLVLKAMMDAAHVAH